MQGECAKIDFLSHRWRDNCGGLIDLKKGRFKAEYKGQMELYLRWLEKNEMEPGEESPLIHLALHTCRGSVQEKKAQKISLSTLFFVPLQSINQ